MEEEFAAIYGNMCVPDYGGHNVVNLLSSVIQASGGESPHPECPLLSASMAAEYRHIMVVLLDGMGCEQIAAMLGKGLGYAFWKQTQYNQLSTVFPATTAAVVTTFGTGATPQEHGVFGWYTYLKDLGLVSTILRAQTRMGTPFLPHDYDLTEYMNFPDYYSAVTRMRHLVSYRHIPYSRYSKAGTNWDTRRSCKTLKGLSNHLVQIARTKKRSLTYAYWPEFDTLCHEWGCQHKEARTHFNQIDTMLGELVQRLKGTGTLLLVTADHGLVDVPARQNIRLNRVPGFSECLSVLPSGDARQLICLVRPRYEQQFLDIVNGTLAESCVCIDSEAMLRSGVYGAGNLHPAVKDRLGDYILLAKEKYSFTYAIPGLDDHPKKAHHGGMSSAEMLVPLCVCKVE